jgi:hypothetical protein
LREIELGHTLILNVWENLELGENQWKMIKTLYYIEVLGCLSPLLTIFQLSWSYGSLIFNYMCNRCLSPLKLWVQILLGGFFRFPPPIKLSFMHCDTAERLLKSNYHTIKMAIFIIILKACNRQYSDYSWSLIF